MVSMWEPIKRYRSVVFHLAYGLPLAAITILDALKAVDLGPLLSPMMSPGGVAAVGTAIAVGSIVLHAFSDTYRGSFRDDCKECERHAFPAR